jgi:hypothetical protein
MLTLTLSWQLIPAGPDLYPAGFVLEHYEP